MNNYLNNSPDHLFVYGSLRRKLNHPMHQILASHAKFISEATFQGQLYDIGRFPGAVCSERSQDLIYGEVYHLHQKQWVLRELDHYEGCTGSQGTSPIFQRQCRQITLMSGEVIPAWIYLYNRPTSHLKPIPSGDYLEFIRKRLNRITS